MYRKLFVTICLIFGAAAVGCQSESSSDDVADNLERAGEELGSAAADVAEDARGMAGDVQRDLESAAVDMSENARDTAETAGNQLEDACEQMKEKAGAADTDC